MVLLYELQTMVASVEGTGSPLPPPLLLQMQMELDSAVYQQKTLYSHSSSRSPASTVAISSSGKI